MPSVKTPNYALNADYTYNEGPSDRRTMEAGTFVRPIQLCYVPKHVIEDPRWKLFQAMFEIFCYTRYGIMPIPKSYIQEK